MDLIFLMLKFLIFFKGNRWGFGFADFFCGGFCGKSGTLHLFGDSGGGAIGEIENIGIIEAIGKIESIGAIDVFYC